jgi:hypothetical protein
MQWQLRQQRFEMKGQQRKTEVPPSADVGSWQILLI